MVWFFVLSCVLYAALTTWAVIVLPEGPIPTHWSGVGAEPADGWSSRGGAITVLVALGVFVAALFAAILVVFARSKTLAGLNVPHKDYWIRPENLPASRRRAITDMGLLAGAMMLYLCTVVVSIVQASHDPAARLPGWELLALGVWLTVTVAWTVWMVAVRWRVPPERRDEQPRRP